MKLTKSFIDNLEPSIKSQEIYWDDMIPDLGVRVYPGGGKSWVIRYRIKGRRQLRVIGETYLLTLDEARKRSKVLLLQALDDTDPVKIQRGITVGKLCELYMDRHAKPKKASWKDDERRCRLYLIPAWGKKPASAIQRKDVDALHFDIAHNKKRPYQANRVLEQVSKMFDLAKLWGYYPENSINPAWGIEAEPESCRETFITPEDMPRLAESIRQEPDIRIRSAIQLYLLHGMRKMELLNLRWEDIDWRAKKARLGHHKTRKKTGKAKYVLLCDTAIEILQALPRDSAFIFPGQKPGTARRNIDGAWQRIRKRAGMEHIWLHDLRRTVGCWLAEGNVSLKIIGAVLHQTSERATQVYAHLTDDSQRKAIEFHEKQMKPFIEF